MTAIEADREFQQARTLADRHKLLLFRQSPTRYLICTKDGRGMKRAIEYDADSHTMQWLGRTPTGRGAQYTIQQTECYTLQTQASRRLVEAAAEQSPNSLREQDQNDAAHEPFNAANPSIGRILRRAAGGQFFTQ
jgi:hypothetical protein